MSKGEFAKMADLKKAFDMEDEAEICKLVRKVGTSNCLKGFMLVTDLMG